MVAASKLVLVESPREISASHRAFVNDLRTARSLAMDLVRRMHYWVYEPATKTCSPSKFSGYVAMDFQRYRAAREGNSTGVKFDSGVAQSAITQILGDYQHDHELAQELERWTASIFEEDVLEDIDPAKWQFVRLPVAGAGGLAALAGGWDGSDELVETVLNLRRTSGRAAPDVE
jgi:hypothetical protein